MRVAAPIELLYLGPQPAPELGFEAYGPMVVHPADSLAHLAECLAVQAFDALLLQVDDGAALAALAAWPGLARAVLDAAVVVLAPEPAAADALRLMRLGVQDVLPLREGAALTLARVLRLAVERKRLERSARQAYATDLSTGLPNHAQLMEHMTHLLALREREPAAMALLVLRIGGLGAAASRLGQEAAQVLRRKVAVRLRSGLRAADVVAALGSDSFAVLLAWMESSADAPRVADKLLTSLRRPYSITGQSVVLSVSVGIASHPQQGRDADSLLRRALAEAGAPPLPGRHASGAAAAANDD